MSLSEEQIKQEKEEFYKEFPDEKCTCDECRIVEECEYRYDPYNTQGECLASK